MHDSQTLMPNLNVLMHYLQSLRVVLDELIVLGEEQVRLCESIPEIHKDLTTIYLRLKTNHEQVVQLFHIIGTPVKGVEHSVAKGVDHILAIVRDTVELLRVADQYTIKRFAQHTRYH